MSSDSGSSGDTTTDDTTTEDRDVATIEVKSLYDVFENANDVGEVFAFIWYNPQVMFIWFHFW